MLRRIFGSKAKNAKEGNRKLHNESPCIVYASQSVIKVIKSNRTVKGGMWHTHTHTHTHTQTHARGEMKNLYIILAWEVQK